MANVSFFGYCHDPHTKVEVSSFIYSEVGTGSQILKVGHVTVQEQLIGTCHCAHLRIKLEVFIFTGPRDKKRVRNFKKVGHKSYNVKMQ